MTEGGRSAARGAAGNLIVHAQSELANPHQNDSGRRKLYCERQTVEGATDLNNQRGVLICQLKSLLASSGPLNEELDGGVLAGSLRADLTILVQWYRKGRDSVLPLALGTKRLTASRNDM